MQGATGEPPLNTERFPSSSSFKLILPKALEKLVAFFKNKNESYDSEHKTDPTRSNHRSTYSDIRFPTVVNQIICQGNHRYGRGHESGSYPCWMTIALGTAWYTASVRGGFILYHGTFEHGNIVGGLEKVQKKVARMIRGLQHCP